MLRIAVLLVTFLWCHWNLMANSLSQEDLETLIRESGVQLVSYSKKDAITVYRKPCEHILPEEIKSGNGSARSDNLRPQRG